MKDIIATLNKRYPQLEIVEEDIIASITLITQCYKNGGKVLICGNGGSAADSSHIVGELMKGFLKRRPVNKALADSLIAANPRVDSELLANLQCGLPAINLCESASLLSAYCNDVDPDYIYAQQAFGLTKKGDIFIGLTTSGNAKNVNLAAKIAKALGATVIGMTGANGGALKENADICIKVPETETYKIQELHLPVYHAICAAVEAEFFNE